MKAGELEKRGEKRAEALAAIEKAKEEGDMDEVDKQSRRIVKVTMVSIFKLDEMGSLLSFYCRFFATQIIGDTKDLVVLL